MLGGIFPYEPRALVSRGKTREKPNCLYIRITMPKILHFTDSHIDMANYGRQDPETGLPLRVMDLLKSLDQIVDTAIAEKVDCVIFAGDAYKNRNQAPTFRREWGKRTMRLSRSQIPTILLVGNHDVSPSVARAHAMEEFSTLSVPHVLVVDKPVFLGTEDLKKLCPPGKQLDMQLLGRSLGLPLGPDVLSGSSNPGSWPAL